MADKETPLGMIEENVLERVDEALRDGGQEELKKVLGLLGELSVKLFPFLEGVPPSDEITRTRARFVLDLLGAEPTVEP